MTPLPAGKGGRSPGSPGSAEPDFLQPGNEGPGPLPGSWNHRAISNLPESDVFTNSSPDCRAAVPKILGVPGHFRVPVYGLMTSRLSPQELWKYILRSGGALGMWEA